MKRSYALLLLFIIIVIIVYNFNNYISSNYNLLAIIISNTISLIVATTILFGNKKIEAKIAWTIFVLFMPVIGFLFYMILGVEYNRFRKFDNNKKISDEIDLGNVLESNSHEELMNQLNDYKGIASLVYNLNKIPLSKNNYTEILNNGDVKFARLLTELRAAQKFIHMEYFIIKEGKVFDDIIEILIEKSKSGVEVRILYDDFGCMDLSKSVINRLEQSGIKTSCFNKIDFKLFRPSINYRNHRKIVVIDNRVGFVGGINIGDEYVHLDPYYGFWRDTHLLLEGDSVTDLHRIFIKDWYHTTKEFLSLDNYLKKHPVNKQTGIVQILADGPDMSDNLIRTTFNKMINDAKKRVWITTPYLILDNELVNSLRIASLSGVDVKIIIPGLADRGKKIIYKATEAYFNELLESGVKIYRYDDHFVHSKIIIIDDDVASVGTVNLDYRSFELHFEVTAIIYQDKSIDELIDYYRDDLKNSTEVKLLDWKKRTWRQKTMESIVRIFSPLL